MAEMSIDFARALVAAYTGNSSVDWPSEKIIAEIERTELPEVQSLHWLLDGIIPYGSVTRFAGVDRVNFALIIAARMSLAERVHIFDLSIGIVTETLRHFGANLENIGVLEEFSDEIDVPLVVCAEREIQSVPEKTAVIMLTDNKRMPGTWVIKKNRLITPWGAEKGVPNA